MQWTRKSLGEKVLYLFAAWMIAFLLLQVYYGETLIRVDKKMKTAEENRQHIQTLYQKLGRLNVRLKKGGH